MSTKENIEHELVCEAQICLYWMQEHLTLASYSKEANDPKEEQKNMVAVYECIESCSKALIELEKSQNYIIK